MHVWEAGFRLAKLRLTVYTSMCVYVQYSEQMFIDLFNFEID